MECISKLLPKTTHKTDVISQVRAAFVVRAAQEMLLHEVGPGIAVRSYRGDIVSVACGRPNQAKDIRSRQTELVARLNDRLGCEAVVRIRTAG